jgi:DNA replication ATP-dependent helicase Dna2
MDKAKGTPSLFASLNNNTTPATRLVWQDLMGETRSPPKQDDEITPNERILWDNSIPSYGSYISPMIGRKGRKRARSSSPASSPSHPMPETPAVNVKKLTQALKTPNADPTLELWDRFALQGGNGTSPSGLTNPLLSHLMVSSSPRPSKDAAPHSERSLRKAISCGTQWPKRRKTERAGPVSTSTSQESPNGDSKTSMVSALLKTVTGEINKSTYLENQRDRAPDSPSPQKRSQTRRARVSQSPSKRQRATSNPTLPLPPLPPNANVVDLTEELETGAGAKCSSDYGDDEFDDDTLLELDADLYTIPEHEDDDHTLVAPTVQEPAVVKVNDRDDETSTCDDDFGDIDDDLLEAAEDILTKAASQQHPLNTTTTNIIRGQESDSIPRQVPDILGEEEDDPYGDDFGDFDFDAAELAATQSASASRDTGSASSLPSHVRTVYR